MQEQGSELVQQTVNDSEQVCTHLIAYAEIRAALARAKLEKRINTLQQERVITALEEDWNAFNIIQPVELLIRRAGLHCDQFVLRAYDSIHLASAEAISLQIMPQKLVFASFDRKLNKAVQALGMSILPLKFH